MEERRHLNCSCIGRAAKNELVSAISNRRSFLTQTIEDFKENSEMRKNLKETLGYLEYLDKKIMEIDICQ